MGCVTEVLAESILVQTVLGSNHFIPNNISIFSNPDTTVDTNLTSTILNMDPLRQEFRHFPHLPSELRLKIWSYMAPMPCGILSSRNVCYRNEDQPTSKGFFAVIQTCREARNHLLHQESSSVTPAYPHPLPDYRFVRFHPATPKVIYSAERDVLYLTRSGMLPIILHYTRQLIRKPFCP